MQSTDARMGASWQVDDNIKTWLTKDLHLRQPEGPMEQDLKPPEGIEQDLKPPEGTLHNGVSLKQKAKN
eukprot:306903-Prorocentrum_minimum.AAC.1